MFTGLTLDNLTQPYGHVYRDGSRTQTSMLNSLSVLEVWDGHFPLCMLLIMITQITVDPFPSQVWSRPSESMCMTS